MHKFWFERYPEVSCAGVWYAACYKKYYDNSFPTMGRDVFDYSLMGVNDLELDDPYIFQVARNGDHMMLPFQCDILQFINIQIWVP